MLHHLEYINAVLFLFYEFGWQLRTHEYLGEGVCFDAVECLHPYLQVRLIEIYLEFVVDVPLVTEHIIIY